jgi:malate dehydrogenase (oxaloacetate-decarboxylating)(NADP+)
MQRCRATRPVVAAARLLSADASKRYPVLRTGDTGQSLVRNPLFNKGTAFKMSERDRLGIRGLLPPKVLSMDAQLENELMNLRKLTDPLMKNLAMQDLQDRNETLYHRLLIDNIMELAPIVYTPTVGKVCQHFGDNFRRGRGMYFSSKDKGEMSAMTFNWAAKDIQIVVVTDGSRILGLGDLGANGMGIPIGKLALYCACGGIAPHRVLPVMLDLGTDNLDLLNHPHYLGVQHKRLQGAEYYELLDEFMAAIAQRWPKALIQFEDFSSDKASQILGMYRNDYLCFNDDVQGTGAAVLAGILGSLRQRGKGAAGLKEERIVMCGAGSAGMGILKQLLDALEVHGISREQAAEALYLCDYSGCVGKYTPAAPDKVENDDDATKRLVAHSKGALDGLPLHQLIKAVKPTLLIGCTGKGGLFTEEVVSAMAAGCERPAIFALSNPTANSECTAEEAYVWTKGKAIYASGSPMAEVMLDGKRLIPSQCNNMYIFPGVGLGASLAGAKRVTDRMFIKAAEAVADSLQPADIAEGRVFPQLQTIREVSKAVALAVYQSAIDEEVATIYPKERETIVENVNRRFYDPTYVPLARD